MLLLDFNKNSGFFTLYHMEWKRPVIFPKIIFKYNFNSYLVWNYHMFWWLFLDVSLKPLLSVICLKLIFHLFSFFSFWYFRSSVSSGVILIQLNDTKRCVLFCFFSIQTWLFLSFFFCSPTQLSLSPETSFILYFFPFLNNKITI